MLHQHALILYHLDQWFSTFSMKKATSRLATWLVSHTKEILTQVNWYIFL